MANVITDYQKQAIDFLTLTNTEFKQEFLKTGKYFDGDKEERDIYKITLNRGARSYCFTFGQSINCSGEYLISIYARNLLNVTRKFASKKEVDKLKAGNRFSLVKNDITPNKNFSTPTPYDVLACLQKYNPGTFENFCSEFGYDTDSRKAEKIYNAVVNEWQNVAMLFNDSEIEQLQEIS